LDKVQSLSQAQKNVPANLFLPILAMVSAELCGPGREQGCSYVRKLGAKCCHKRRLLKYLLHEQFSKMSRDSLRTRPIARMRVKNIIPL